MPSLWMTASAAGPARGAARLLGDHGAHRALGPAGARHHPGQLHLLVAIDHPDPVDPTPPTARLDQQRDVEHRERRGRGGDALRDLEADAGMQDALEAAPRLDVGKGGLAHAGAVEGAAGIDEVGAEGLADRSIAAPPARVRLRAIASVSISSAPSSTSRVATVLLPLPMPPVRPTRSSSRHPKGRAALTRAAARSAISSSPKNIAAMPAAGEVGAERESAPVDRGCEGDQAPGR
jgi:hypothetical protein